MAGDPSGGIISFIGSLFGALFGGSGNATAGTIAPDALSNFATSIKNALSALAGVIAKAIGAIWDFLKSLWENFIKKMLEWLRDHLVKLYQWIHAHAKSLIDHLKKWKQWYDQHILPFQLKQIALIQRIRQVLQILTAFHVKWAQNLDAKLGDLQQKLVATVETIRGAFNSVINFANLIFDPTLLIRRNALAGSLLNSLGALKRITGFGSGLPLTSNQQNSVDHWSNYYSKSETLAYMQTVNQIGPTAEDQQLDSAFRDALSSATGVAQ